MPVGSSTPSYPPHPSPPTSNLLSVSRDLPLLDSSCKCNEPVDVCSVFDYSVTLVVFAQWETVDVSFVRSTRPK